MLGDILNVILAGCVVSLVFIVRNGVQKLPSSTQAWMQKAHRHEVDAARAWANYHAQRRANRELGLTIARLGRRIHRQRLALRQLREMQGGSSDA